MKSKDKRYTGKKIFAAIWKQRTNFHNIKELLQFSKKKMEKWNETQTKTTQKKFKCQNVNKITNKCKIIQQRDCIFPVRLLRLKTQAYGTSAKMAE